MVHTVNSSTICNANGSAKSPVMTTHSPDAWTLSAAACAAMEHWEDTQMFIEAAQRATDGWTHDHRILRLQALAAMITERQGRLPEPTSIGA